MRKYPWLPPVDYRDKGETAAQLMTPTDRLVIIEDGCTLRELGKPCLLYIPDLVQLREFRCHGQEVHIPRLSSSAKSRTYRLCHTR